MGKFIDLTGGKFGLLTVVKRDGSTDRKKARWLCMCECGNETHAISYELKNSHKRSCGCLHKKQLINRSTKHGMAHKKIYAVWCGIITRCFNKKSAHYNSYGERGITMCDEWKNDFMKFYEYMGDRPSDKHQIDRIDNNGNYEPGNCRWVTNKENAKNKQQSKKWMVDGLIFDTAKEAGLYFNKHATTIKGWCEGFRESRSGKWYPAKKNCNSIKLYR